MNKNLTAKIILLILFLILLLGKSDHLVRADWYTRSDIRPTQPSIERNLPSAVVEPTVETQISPTSVVTPPPIGDPGVTNTPAPTAVPTATPTPTSGNSTSSTGGGNQSSEATLYYGPQVLGLSNTAGEGLPPSDIILLAGILCLTLYLRSKLTVNRQN